VRRSRRHDCAAEHDRVEALKETLTHAMIKATKLNHKIPNPRRYLHFELFEPMRKQDRKYHGTQALN
jgi:hypothetical protein